MRSIIFASLAAVSLAACSGGTENADADGDGSVSAEEVKAATAKVKPLQPGMYKMSMKLEELEDPSMSAEEVEQARGFFESMGNMAPPRCLTTEEANKGMVGLAEQLQSGDCKVDSMTSTDTTFKTAMTCKGPTGEGKATLDGTSTGTESQMTMAVTEPGKDGKSEKRMVMTVGMTRTGDCPAEKAG